MGGHHRQVLAESQTLFFSFFFLCVLLLMGACGFHCQFLAKGEPKLPFSSFFPSCFVAYGCRWSPLPILNKKGAQAPFFFFFFSFYFVLMGVSGCHCQVQAEGELAPPFFIFVLLVLGCHC
jgi:hypothetical protein